MTKKKDGIYFNMPENEYHALERFSSSGLKWLHVSPEDFWFRSWMNPAKEEVDEDTPFMIAGKAYHKRILEGRDAFYSEYCKGLSKDDFDDLLVTSDDIKGQLKDLGQKVSGNKADLIDRLIAACPEALVWDRLVEDHAMANDGLEMLDPELVDRIEVSAKFIEKHPVLSKAFVGGFPEVTILWTDPQTGVRMKARLDYLKIRATVDLKTFSNPQGKMIDTAINHAFGYNRYHVQAAVYNEARKNAVHLAKKNRIFGFDGDRKWIDQFIKADSWKTLFVFQQTGVAPLARGWVFPDKIAMGAAEVIVRQRIDEFKALSDTYGTDTWIGGLDLSEFEDERLPMMVFE